MEQGLRLLWNPMIHYCFHKDPPLVPILSQMQQVHNFPLHSSKIHSNVIFPSTTSSYKCFLTFRFSNQNIVCIPYFFHLCYMLRPSYPLWLDHRNNICWSIQVKKLITIPSSPATSSLLGTNILLSILSADTLSLFSSLSVRDQVSQLYKTKGKIKVFVYFDLPIFGEVPGTQKTLNRIIASIPWI